MKKSKNVLYEMMVITKSLLPEDVRKVVHKSIASLFEELDGELHDTDVWGKRYLAYKIGSQSEGYYIVYTFSLPTSSMSEFKRRMDLQQDVLRYLLVVADEQDTQRLEEKKNAEKVNA